MKAQKKIWMDGKLIPWDDAKIHVLTHGLHYGMAVFEGIRAFDTPEGTAVFRLGEHIERFMNSAKIYRMDLGYSAKEIERACIEVVKNNPAKECYIRPIAFTGYGEMGLSPLTSKISVAIGSWEWGAYLGDTTNQGVRATISAWMRIDSRTMPVQAKSAANYANSGLAKMQALTSGYDEAILLNTDGKVAEGTGENIFRVKDGILSTPPASSGILRGITRDTVIQFAWDQKIKFYRNDATREELYTSDEVFFSGTAAGIAKVREIDGRHIGYNGTPVTDLMARLYREATHGKIKKYKKWLTLAV